jgi:hypothetical protein
VPPCGVFTFSNNCFTSKPTLAGTSASLLQRRCWKRMPSL